MQYEVRALGRDKLDTVLVDALNEADACRQVAARALQPLSARPLSRIPWLKRPGRKPVFSLLLFSQELLALLEAGLSVVEALDALAEKERRPDARHILVRLIEHLRQGKSLSAALAGMPEAFPPLYVGIVRAAERTSSLPESLGRYIDYQVRLDTVKSKVLSASIYPAILLVVGTLVTLFLLGYVVPRFTAVYQGTGRQLPWLSALLMHWGTLVAEHGAAVTGTGFVGVVGIFLAGRELFRQGRLESLLQRIPGLADTIQTFQLARLYLTLGMLLEGGLPIVQSLALVSNLLSPQLQERARSASSSIERGETLSQAFERCHLTTPVGLRMLRVGEQSGRMGDMLARTAKIYDGEISRAIEWFTRVFEPLLMTAIGLVIGLIVVLLYMPIFDLAGSLQ